MIAATMDASSRFFPTRKKSVSLCELGNANPSHVREKSDSGMNPRAASIT